jgi:hypothetical protein
MMGMLGNAGTPQGFASLAGMMPGAVRTLGNIGGMPAIMGTYQYLKSMRGGEGANDWKILTDPNHKAAFVKQALNPWLGVSALGNRAAAGIGSSNPWLQGQNNDLDFQMGGIGSRMPLSDLTKSETVAHPGRTIAKNLGMDLARREGMYQGASRSAKFWGPKLGLEAAEHIPGIKGGLLWDTPINAAEDAGDLAGVLPHWAGGKGDTLWFKAQRDPGGNLQYDQNADLQGQYGWNPRAFGNWDMQAFDKSTTLDGKWGFGLAQSGNPRLDNALSYAGAAYNGASRPLKGAYSLGKFQYYDMNPLRDWDAIAHPSRLTNADYHANSIPGIAAQNMALGTSLPAPNYMPGGKYFDAERRHYAGRYHPVYNPDESNGKPWYAYLGL